MLVLSKAVLFSRRLQPRTEAHLVFWMILGRGMDVDLFVSLL